MTTRAEFLARVAAQLDSGLSTNLIRPLEQVWDTEIEYTVRLDDPLETFSSAAESAGAEVVELGRSDLIGLVRELVQDAGEAQVMLADDESLLPLAEALTRTQIGLVSHSAARDMPDVAVGITGATAGIAVTGSVVVDSAVPGARVASLIPDTHLVVLEKSKIAATPGEFFKTLSGDGYQLPSNLVLITGPSRSADIELQLTIGVHGPSRLVVALTGEDEVEPSH